MSMQYSEPIVRWQYAYTPEENSAEALLYTDFLKPKDWLNLDEKLINKNNQLAQ